ncbi:g9342 [Coccomyxa viridis]|uniref:G9342 protein n=1 Tax=Coccomyxa viridis TaxID=1274662 RepID=A0ABP1G8Z4_9CHLO
MMQYLTSPIVLAIGAAIVTLLLMKADGRICNEERKNWVCCKNSVLVACLVGATAYFLRSRSSSSLKISMKGGGGLEDVMVGEPNF